MNDTHLKHQGCLKITELISLKQEAALNYKQLLHLYVHLMMCSACRAFYHNTKTLSIILKQYKNITIENDE